MFSRLFSRKSAFADYNDTQLVTACRNGQEEAWRVLVERYQRLVYTIPLRYGLSASEAEDVFQTVWLILLEHLPTLEQPERLSAWLVTTAKRECWHKRRGADYKRTDSVAPSAMPLNRWLTELTPEEIVSQHEEATAVTQHLAQLNERCRQLLWYLYSDPAERPYNEIAAQLNMPLGSLSPTRARCLQKLRELMTK